MLKSRPLAVVTAFSELPGSGPIMPETAEYARRDSQGPYALPVS
jgi:hypothetical protein